MFEFREIRCPRCKSLVPIGYIVCPYCGYDLRSILRMRARKELTLNDILRRIRDSIPIYSGSLIPYDLFNELMIAPDTIGPFIIISIFSLMISLIYLRIIAGLGLLGSLNPLVLFFGSLIVSIIMTFILFMLYVLFINWLFRLIGVSTAEFGVTFSIIGYSLWPMIVTSFLTVFIMIAYNPGLIIGDFEGALTAPILTVARYIIFGGFAMSLFIANEGISKAYYINKILSFIILLIPSLIIFIAV